ncbi:MAG: class I SAM-dependent methyltransferase [Mycobacteriales bacterium]
MPSSTAGQPLAGPPHPDEQPSAAFGELADPYLRYSELKRPRIQRYLTANLTERLAERPDGRLDRQPDGQLSDSGKRALGTGLDLGCGSGRFTGLLAECCQRVVAIDAAQGQLDKAQQHHPFPNVEYRLADLMKLDPGEQRFDVVLTVNTLFHTYASHEPAVVLQHVADLIAPGGLLVIVDVVAPPTHSALRQRLRGFLDAGKILQETRSPSDAWFVLRFRQSKGWMRHVHDNLPLSHQAFEATCRQVFRNEGSFTWPITTGDPYQAGFTWHRPR